MVFRGGIGTTTKFIPLVAVCGRAANVLAAFKRLSRRTMANKEWGEWIGKSDGVVYVASKERLEREKRRVPECSYQLELKGRWTRAIGG